MLNAQCLMFTAQCSMAEPDRGRDGWKLAAGSWRPGRVACRVAGVGCRAAKAQCLMFNAQCSMPEPDRGPDGWKLAAGSWRPGRVAWRVASVACRLSRVPCSVFRVPCSGLQAPGRRRTRGALAAHLARETCPPLAAQKMGPATGGAHRDTGDQGFEP